MYKSQIIGYLGKDAEIREVNGKHVINFSVAHTEKWHDAQQVEHERTTWVTIEYWRPDHATATRFATFLRKGTQVYVEGTPRNTAYISRQTNEPVADDRIRANFVKLLGSRPATDNQPATRHATPAQSPLPQTRSEDVNLPF